MYSLAPDTHLCLVQGAAVFLDLRGNRYVRLTQVQTGWLMPLLEEGGSVTETDEQDFAGRLLARGLLQHGPSASAKMVTSAHPAPLASLLELDPAGRPSACAMAGLALALLASRRASRGRNLLTAVSAARRWKARAARRPVPSADAVIAATRAFHSVTPYFFTIHDACLFRSLVLARYLTWLGARPDWVFGVRLAPFAAHCWIEHAGLALNEQADTIGEFSPILIV
jgi:hypothetical protein